MTSSGLESPTRTTGVHRARRRTPRMEARRPSVRYEPYLDGLFTYCLSVLCDHDSATEALGDVVAISERQHGRCPSGAGERRAWLYALARWACLRRLSERRGRRQGAHAGHRARQEAAAAPVAPKVAERRLRELATLAWPEAAGTTPEQRAALELAVRHRLGPRDVAAVLSMELLPARELLSSAACEVERTRAAVAVVETGDCPAVARLTGDHQVLFSAVLRRELVRHVDDCPRCRRAAERAEAAGPWPGSDAAAAAAPSAMPFTHAASNDTASTHAVFPHVASPTPPPAVPPESAFPQAAPSWAVSPAVLPLVKAPRAAAYGTLSHASRARPTPRFGRNGFPMDPKDRAKRRDRLRARAVTTTVVATVVAAPVLALWAAYRGAPPIGDSYGGASVSAGEAEQRPGRIGGPNDTFENAGNAENRPSDPSDPSDQSGPSGPSGP